MNNSFPPVPPSPSDDHVSDSEPFLNSGLTDHDAEGHTSEPIVDGAASAAASAASKKKKNIIMFSMFGVLGLIVIYLAVSVYFKKTRPAVAPRVVTQSQPAKPPAAPVSAPTSVKPTPSAPASVTPPATTGPSPANPVTTDKPSSGLDLLSGSDTSSNAVPPAVSPSLPGNPELPQSPNSDSKSADGTSDSAASADPFAALMATPPPASSGPASSDNSNKKSEAKPDAAKSLSGTSSDPALLQPQSSQVNPSVPAKSVDSATLNDIRLVVREELQPYDARLSRLEKSRSSSPATSRSGSTRASTTHASKPQTRTQSRTQNRIEVLSPVASSSSVPSPPVSCSIQAIIPGRAWVKQSDGTTQTYGLSDTWTDGSVIEAISPGKGIVSGGRLVCRAYH